MMLRQRENPESVKAGVFSVLVHVMLLGALLISFNWKTTHPISIAQVELWDSVPVPQQMPVVPPEPDLPPPVEKELPKPEPVAEPIAKPEPQVEIAIEKKPLKKELPKPVNKINDALAKLQDEARQDALKNKNTAKPDVNEALKKLQQESLSEDKTAGEQKNTAAKSAASAGVVDEFKAKIQSKIRSHVQFVCRNPCHCLRMRHCFRNLETSSSLSGLTSIRSDKLIRCSGIMAL